MAQQWETSLTYIRSDHGKTGSHSSVISATTGNVQEHVESHQVQMGAIRDGFLEEDMNAEALGPGRWVDCLRAKE